MKVQALPTRQGCGLVCREGAGVADSYDSNLGDYRRARGLGRISGLAQREDEDSNMSLEKEIETALDNQGVAYQNVVEVDPTESDYLITGVKIKPNEVKQNKTLSGAHSVPAGKSIIRRLEDLADSDFKRYMRVGRDCREENFKGFNSDTSEISHLDSRVEGICECLAIMKNTSRGIEYEDVLNRYQNEITMGDPRPHDPNDQVALGDKDYG